MKAGAGVVRLIGALVLAICGRFRFGSGATASHGTWGIMKFGVARTSEPGAAVPGGRSFVHLHKIILPLHLASAKILFWEADGFCLRLPGPIRLAKVCAMSMTNQTRDIARFSAQTKNLADAAAAFSSRAELALHGVYEISKILAVPARLETTLSNVLTLLSSFLEMRHGMIALLADDGAPRAVVGVGWSEDHAKAYFERLPERAIGQIVATKMPVVIEDVAKNPLFSEWYAAEREPTDCRISFIGVPIKERDKVIGTLTIDRIWDNRANFRLDEDVRFLVMIANLVGQTVRLHSVIGRDRERLMDEQRRLEKELSGTAGTADREVKLRGVVGQSEAIRNVMDKIKIVARSNTTVLLRGESGTGKELFAHATHELSPRKKGPFIKLNCAALPESMLEFELFGHEKGSFTGAVNQRKGRFELADKGTLFFDEIGEISSGIPGQASPRIAGRRVRACRRYADAEDRRALRFRHQQEPGRGCRAGRVPF